MTKILRTLVLALSFSVGLAHAQTSIERRSTMLEQMAKLDSQVNGQLQEIMADVEELLREPKLDRKNLEERAADELIRTLRSGMIEEVVKNSHSPAMQNAYDAAIEYDMSNYDASRLLGLVYDLLFSVKAGYEIDVPMEISTMRENVNSNSMGKAFNYFLILSVILGVSLGDSPLAQATLIAGPVSIVALLVNFKVFDRFIKPQKAQKELFKALQGELGKIYLQIFTHTYTLARLVNGNCLDLLTRVRTESETL